jgi:hypothetical protein
VLFTQALEYCGRAVAVACLGTRGGFDEAVRDATHRGDDDDQGILARGLCHDFCYARDAGSIPYRRASKFHNLQE